MLVLGIESSCDETAAAVVEDGTRIRSNVVHSQVPVHAKYGGVVPELASRNHVMAILPVIEKALGDAGVTPEDLDLVAVTVGPGLVGSLLVGLETAKMFAWVHDLPLIGVNHIEGHVLSPLVDAVCGPRVRFPYVALVASGGHTSLFDVREVGRYRCLGRTLDDAAGEAFDKVAKRLGGPYPGGPWIERTASGGDPARFPMPRPLYGKGLDFSFSGLKTAVATCVDRLEREGGEGDWVADVCAATQDAVSSVLVRKALKAARKLGADQIALAGGVACNGPLREHAEAEAAKVKVEVLVPARSLCTDNAAMIACVGGLRWARLGASARAGFGQHGLDVAASLPLDAAPPGSS